MKDVKDRVKDERVRSKRYVKYIRWELLEIDRKWSEEVYQQ